MKTKRELRLFVKKYGEDKYILQIGIEKNLSGEEDKILGEGLFYSRELGIPATDWIIDSILQSRYGFESQEYFFKKLSKKVKNINEIYTDYVDCEINGIPLTKIIKKFKLK